MSANAAAKPDIPPTSKPELVADGAHAERIDPGQLTLHADRGTSMTSRTVAQLLADLGVTGSHSRPHVSNDNPFSEAQFKTLKHTPRFPERFASLAHARSFVDTLPVSPHLTRTVPERTVTRWRTRPPGRLGLDTGNGSVEREE